MKRLAIHTVRYENELKDFAAKAEAAGIIEIKRDGKSGKRRVLECCFSDWGRLPEALMGTLMDIAEKENPVYRHSSKLREVAGDLRHTALFGREARRLRGFLKANNSLNLEGYATFRMCEYRDKLDMMVYSLVKKFSFGSTSN